MASHLRNLITFSVLSVVLAQDWLFSDCLPKLTSLFSLLSDIDNFAENLKNVDEDVFEMFWHSGKYMNDLGNYPACNKMDEAKYAHVSLSSEIPHIELGLCVPESCSELELKGALGILAAELFAPDLFEEDSDDIDGSKSSDDKNDRRRRALQSLNAQHSRSLKDDDEDFDVKIVFSYEEETKAKKHPSDGARLMKIITFLLVVLVVIGTGVDLYRQNKSRQYTELNEKEVEMGEIPGQAREVKIQQSLPVPNQPIPKWQELIISFSIYTNTRKLFAPKANFDPLDSLNFIRVVSMAWVVLGHYFLFTIIFRPSLNWEAYFDALKDTSFTCIYGALYAVDTFFWLSGLLTGYLLLLELDKGQGRTRFGLAYLHRYIRLIPPYVFAMFFILTLKQCFGDGPRFYMSQDMGDECEDYWWTNVLFINNFWPDFEGNGCFGHAWYLANDFQFFLITPPILYIYYNRKTLYGWISVASLVAIHLIVTGILVGVNNFRIVGGEDDDEKF